MPRKRSRRLGCWILLAVSVVLLFFGWWELQRLVREHPERFPWTELSLSDPVGPFTGIKLAALTDAPDRCRALLASSGLSEQPVDPPASDEEQCRFQDAVLIRPESRRSIDYSPSALITSCPVASALAIWEREVVEPAARRHFDSRVVRIDHAGSFSCRRVYGRSDGRYSEHSTADAIDIVAFRLGNGRRVTVLRDWSGESDEMAFLRDVRAGACDLFSTVLSPDYNSAHADHFHLDMAKRGQRGGRLCD